MIKVKEAFLREAGWALGDDGDVGAEWDEGERPAHRWRRKSRRWRSPEKSVDGSCREVLFSLCSVMEVLGVIVRDAQNICLLMVGVLPGPCTLRGRVYLISRPYLF